MAIGYNFFVGFLEGFLEGFFVGLRVVGVRDICAEVTGFFVGLPVVGVGDGHFENLQPSVGSRET